MTLIQIGDRVLNLDNLNYAQHYIQTEQSYTLLYLNGQVQPLQLKGESAERVWSILEDYAAIAILTESIDTQ